MLRSLEPRRRKPHLASFSRSMLEAVRGRRPRRSSHVVARANLSASAHTDQRKPSLAGLGREALKAAFRALGVPDRELNMRVGQLWHWLYFRGARDFAQMTTIGKALRAPARGQLHARSSRGGGRAGVAGRHAQVAVAARCRETAWQGRRDRMCLHPRGGSRHPLHLEPGGLHPHVHVLPHRHPEARSQSLGRRDRGAGDGGP